MSAPGVMSGRWASVYLVSQSGLAPLHEAQRWTDSELAEVVRTIQSAQDTIERARQRLNRYTTPPTC